MRQLRSNHEAEGEGADDGDSDGESGELDVSDVAYEHGGDGVISELAENLERDWAAYSP